MVPRGAKEVARDVPWSLIARAGRPLPRKGKTMQFTSNVVASTPGTSRTEEVFSRDIVLVTEVAGESKIPAGHVALIDSYRGFTLSNERGRKARDAGQTVVNLSAFEKVALAEIPELINKLQELYEAAPDAADALEALREPAIAAAAANAEEEDENE